MFRLTSIAIPAILALIIAISGVWTAAEIAIVIFGG